MKKIYSITERTGKIWAVVFALLLTGGTVSAGTTLTFTNNTTAAISDGAYNGTLGSMASTSVTVSGVPAGAVITDIKVVAAMNHTWVGDLVIKLGSPTGSVLGLASRPGYSEPADDGTGGFGLSDNLISTSPITFSDTGTYDAEVMGAIGDANNICADDGQCSFFPNPGAVTTPPSTFSDFYAGTINGTWTFYAGDAGGGDVGDISAWTLEITYEIAPANDDCANAITIGCSLSASVAGTTTASSVDAVYSNCGAGGDNTTEQGVWYVYPGDNSLVTITTCDANGTGYDSRLTVYSGSCGSLTCVTANDDMAPDCATGLYRSSVTFNAFTGTNYYVFVHGYQTGTDLSATGDFILNLSCGPLCTPVPANDECASAQALSLGVAANGSTVCSNSTPGLINPLCASAFITPLDNWYTFTTGAGSAYNITLTELTATNLGFSIYTGTCGSLTEIGAFCSSAGTLAASLTPFTTYYIRVFNSSSVEEGTYTLNVNSFTPVANDDCADVTPTVLVNGTGAVTLTGSTVNASASADELNYLGFATVWEAVTLTGTCNNLTVDFCGTAAGVMAQGYVTYTDCPITGTTVGISDFTTCVDGNLTVNYYNLPAGTYYLPVISDPVFNTLGTYTMHVSSVNCNGAPANDDCTSASPIACASSATGTTINATLDGPATSCTGGSVAPDVWYTYTGTGQDFTASLCSANTDYDTKLDIYTGTCASLVAVDCNDDYCSNQSQVAVSSSTLGATYYIRVHGFSGDVGNYELSILDNDPTIACPANVNINTDAGICTASNVSLGTPVAGDDCGVASVTNDAPATYPTGTTTVTWTVTDLAGHTATCTQTVTVTDNESPVITCPPNLSVNAAAGLCVSAALNIGTATATDNCGIASIVSDASTTTFPVGITTVTWTATDVHGNISTCAQTITVSDIQQPIISCPAAISVNADAGSCDATGVALGSPTTSDNCGVANVSNDAPVSYPIGTTIVTWTATDVNGNTASCTQSVTVADNELPVITCPANVTASADAGVCSATGVAIGLAIATDNCAGTVITNDAPSSFAVGTTTVTWTATDASGNIATCAQTVTVTDDELPVITCNASITVNNETGVCGISNASLTIPVTTDNCGIASITNDAASTIGIGATVVTWTATDVNGNVSTCTQSVTVVDNELPTITCPTDLSVPTDIGSCDATGVTLGTPVTNDNCAMASVTNDAPSSFPTGTTTVTWTVTDVNGNSATCTQTVSVIETELPVITCPADVTASADLGLCSASNVNIGLATATDNCPGTVITNNAPSSFPVGTTTVTWTATDAAGNTATCTQTVTVTDDELPVITCVAVTVNNAIGVCGIPGASLTAPVTTDNCGVASVTSDAAVTLPIGSTTVTWTATDVHGNVSTCTQSVTVIDNELPTITCPVDVSVPTDLGSCDATGVALGTPTTGDNCGVASVTNDAPASYPAGNTTVTWTVTDVNGNIAICTQTVTVIENEAPVITCPADITVTADAGICGAASVVLGTPIATDNCVGVTVSNDAPSTFPVGTTTVTWTATDASGNTATCTQTVTITDDEVPVITCPASITVNNDAGVCGALGSSLTPPVASDNCSVASIVSDAPVTLPIGTTSVTWTATDASGNTASCSQSVTVLDNELPTVTCPTDVSVNTDAASCVATNVVLGTPITNDNCAVATVTNDAPSSFALGNTTVTWTVMDVNGNTATCAQMVSVSDHELPLLTCPADVTASADAGQCSASAVNIGTASASDNCTVSSVTNDATASFSVGVTTVTWTATDAAGNISTCAQTVTVTDDELPVITCGVSITINNTAGDCGALNTSLTSPTATDNCSIASITNDAPSTLSIGTTTVTWTATDASGNTATCSQSITVVDNEVPSIVCPADVSATTDAGSCSATNVTLGTPTTADNCSVASVSNDAPSAFNIGNTTVTWTVTDVNGNTATCTQTVTIADTELPSITCPADVSVTADAGSCNATSVVLGTATATDNCTVASITNDAPSTFPAGVTTVTWTATDVAGNTSTCTQTVTVTDAELPVITCAGSITINNTTGTCGADATSLVAPTATDNCGIATVSSDAATTLPIGITTVTWTATDVNGNSASCTQSITVVDNEAPTIACPANFTVSADAGSCTASNITWGTAITSDNCGIDTVYNDATATFAIGTTTVTWTVVDVNGNTATCTQTVTVVDNESPVITCPANVTVTADAGACTAANVALGTATVTDNCSGTTVSSDAPASFPIGITTVTWTASDAAGNNATCTQTVTVNDTEVPVITCPADVTVNADAGQCSAASVTIGTATATDNCGTPTVTNDAPSSYPVGLTVVTWTATDAGGNVAQCAQRVTVNDNQNPTITCPADVTTNVNASPCVATGVALGLPATADNCSIANTASNAPAQFQAGVTTVTWTTTDIHGHTANCTQHITVNAVVDTAVTLTGPTFTAHATNASYQWYNCTTSSNVSGQTASSFKPTATGAYALIVTQNGCRDTSACFNFIYISVGDPIAANGFRIYPNPATDLLRIEVSGTINGVSKMQLFNAAGQVVRELSAENISGVQTIPLDGLASDIYILRISTDDGVWNTKVMKVN